MAEMLYRVQGVSRLFRQGDTGIRAVDRVDLEVERGDFVVIVGPSGSGKSTLLQLLGGLDLPASGTLQFEGSDLTKLGEAELCELRLRAFGFVFQQFNLIPTLTAQENVEAAIAPTGAKTPERRRRAADLLAEVGLAGRANHLPPHLSGGEQQRVAIARALANRPRVILADEPTGNLDSATGVEILELLSGLRERHGQTVVMVTHDTAAARLASAVFVMRDGRLRRAQVVKRPEPAREVAPGAPAPEAPRGSPGTT